MLFAAGFGTRMKALTQDQPKPLIKVAGRALVDHTLALASEIKPRKVVANLHYKADQLQKHLSPLGVETIVEKPDILDTGGGLKAALPLLQAGTVITSNTDAIWSGPNPFKVVQDHWDPTEMDALLLCVPVAHTIGHESAGDFHIADDMKLSRGAGFVYGGIQIIKSEVLEHLQKQVFSLNVVWDQIASKDRLMGCVYPGKWCDVGHPEGITLAENMLKEGYV